MKKKTGLLCTIALLGATFLQTSYADPNQDAFKKLDKDNNGFVTRAEAEGTNIEEAFDEADGNSDGKVDLAEFSALELTSD